MKPIKWELQPQKTEECFQDDSEGKVVKKQGSKSRE